MTSIPAHILPLLTTEQAAQYQGYIDAMSDEERRQMRRRAARRKRGMLSTQTKHKSTALTVAAAPLRRAYSTR